VSIPAAFASVVAAGISVAPAAADEQGRGPQPTHALVPVVAEAQLGEEFIAAKFALEQSSHQTISGTPSTSSYLALKSA
jgi:hypothetical protein